MYIGRTPTGAILTSADIADGSISTAKLADTAVSKAKIANDAVDNTKLDLTANYAFTGTVTGTPQTLVKTGSITSTTNGLYNLDNVFSSTYMNYFVTFKFAIATDGNQCHLRFRTGGVTNTSANYQSGTRIIDQSGSFDTESNANGNSAKIGTSLEATDTHAIQGFMYFNSPFSTTYYTQVQTHFNLRTSSGTKKFCFGGIEYEGTTSFDGFQLTPNTGDGSLADIQVFGIKE